MRGGRPRLRLSDEPLGPADVWGGRSRVRRGWRRSSARPCATRSPRRSTTPRSPPPGSTGCSWPSRWPRATRRGPRRDARPRPRRPVGHDPHKDDVAALVDERSADAEALGRGELRRAGRRRAAAGREHRRGGVPGRAARGRASIRRAAGARARRRGRGPGGGAGAGPGRRHRGRRRQPDPRRPSGRGARRRGRVAPIAGRRRPRRQRHHVGMAARTDAAAHRASCRSTRPCSDRARWSPSWSSTPSRRPCSGGAAAGCAAVDGVGMLVHQAAVAFEAWTGLGARRGDGRGARAELRSG